jgi:lysophospholipase L1-like esterase
VSAAAALGQDRAGQPAGNLWNLKPQYDADGVHLTTDGHQKLAEVVGAFIVNNY